MAGTPLRHLAIFVSSLTLLAQDQPPAHKLEWQAGPVNIRPSGFFDWIGEWRSVPTSDNVYTRFARIPLVEGPDEVLGSPAHSRGMVKSTARQDDWSLTGYYEFDFLDPNRKNWFRTRQAWGEVAWGTKWRLLGGKAWSLLRPNRLGTASDREMLNTDVIEPAYHVGLVGNRRQQLRLTRTGDHWSTVFALERRSEGTGGDFLTKVVRENGHLHMEAIGLAAGAGRRALSISAVIPITHTVRFITQEFVARHAAAEALSFIPVGVSGASFIQGVEANLTKSTELYSYGGLVYGSRSRGNRLCREWTIGANHRIPAPGSYGSFLTGFQFSQLDRELWRGGSGSMNYIQVQFRYTLW